MISARPPKRADWQPTANDFAERGEIGLNAEELLSSAARHAEAGHHFIEDQQRAMFRALVAQSLEEILAREIEPGVGRDRFEDNGRDRFRVLRERRRGRLRCR